MKCDSSKQTYPEGMHGQGLVEYALILVFVTLAVILMLTIMHDVLRDTYCKIILTFGGDGGGICTVSSLPMYIKHLV